MYSLKDLKKKLEIENKFTTNVEAIIIDVFM
jgi:hypothetical protein